MLQPMVRVYARGEKPRKSTKDDVISRLGTKTVEERDSSRYMSGKYPDNGWLAAGEL